MTVPMAEAAGQVAGATVVGPKATDEHTGRPPAPLATCAASVTPGGRVTFADRAGEAPRSAVPPAKPTLTLAAVGASVRCSVVDRSSVVPNGTASQPVSVKLSSPLVGVPS